MKGYEQLEFEETRAARKQNALNESKIKCLDNVGNEIKIGDYVVAVSGEAKVRDLEGIVIEIFCDDVSCNIIISTLGGKIVECNGNPSSYEVITK